MKPITLKIADIRTDAGTQTRVTTCEETVTQYAEAMMLPDADFPPVVVFHNGTEYFMADGFHRVLAAVRNGAETIMADVRKGSKLDALKFALGANDRHGLKRTNADKRRCVEIALNEFPDWSDRRIADVCGVSDKTVAATKAACGNSAPDRTAPAATRTGKDGKKYRVQNRSDVDPDEEPPAVHSTDEIVNLASKSIPKLGPPRDGMQFARLAVMQLEQIRNDDAERTAAFDYMKGWLKDNE